MASRGTAASSRNGQSCNSSDSGCNADRVWCAAMAFSLTGLFVCLGVLASETSWPELLDFGPALPPRESYDASVALRKISSRLRGSSNRLDDRTSALAVQFERHFWRDRTIFVSIASFRDVRCRETVEDIFATAANPRRVVLGIIEQNEHGDPTCIPNAFHNCVLGGFCPIDNIRRRRVASRHGRGPTYGRYVAMLMYRGESYFMMIDSHNVFKGRKSSGWDTDATTMLYFADSPKPVLSHYPLSWRADTDVDAATYVTVMCRAHFVSQGYVRMGGLNFGNSKRPRKQPFTAAGFLFADAAMVHEVPFDPYLDFLFDGEELLYSARLYTHGWDSFAPSHNIVFHDYERHTAPRFWHIHVNQWGVRQQTSVARVQWLLKIVRQNSGERYVRDNTTEIAITREATRYGLGDARSLDQFWKLTQLDMVRKIETNAGCSPYFASAGGR